MGLREIESEMSFKFCGENSDIEVYFIDDERKTEQNETEQDETKE